MALTIKHTALFSSTLFSTTVCRGETFQKEFLAIGKARGLVPSHVNMMALTATATRATMQTPRNDTAPVGVRVTIFSSM